MTGPVIAPLDSDLANMKSTVTTTADGSGNIVFTYAGALPSLDVNTHAINSMVIDSAVVPEPASVVMGLLMGLVVRSVRRRR